MFLPGLIVNDSGVGGVEERPVGACLPLSFASAFFFALCPSRYSTELILLDATPSPEHVTLLPAMRPIYTHHVYREWNAANGRRS